jgi:hypothetical protein
MKITSPVITWYDVRQAVRGHVSYGFIQGRLCFQIRINSVSRQDAVETVVKDPKTGQAVIDPKTDRPLVLIKKLVVHNLFSNIPSGCDTMEQGKESAFVEMAALMGTKQHSAFWDLPMPDHTFRLHPM